MTEQSISAYPKISRRAMSDSYHGVTVTEAYRWMENFDDPEVLAWNEDQNRHSRAAGCSGWSRAD